MDVDEDDDVINLYYSLIEHLEKLKSFMEDNNFKHYPTIQQNLFNCSRQMDFIITLETDHSSFLVNPALCQQKHQLTMLSDIVGQLQNVEQFQNVNNNTNMSMRQQFCHNTQNQTFSKKPTKHNKNDQAEHIVSSTAVIPKVDGLNKIIGLHDIKRILKSLTLLPKTQPQLFYNRGIYNTILLYGPPGTGKTRLSHAVAAESKANFHCISAGDILSHYVGQTEKTIKTLFQSLKSSCEFTILFIDEIDAFCRKRTGNEQEHTRRIKTEFMCQMSSIEDCKNLIVICATNCPWDLDSAILRRLQKRIYIPLPNQMERLEFFRFLTINIHIEDNLHDWTLMVKLTDGYSGSDLHDLVQCAITIPLHELEDTKIWKCCVDGFYEPVLEEQDFSNILCSELRDLPPNSVRARKVRLGDFLTAVDLVKSTVTESDVKHYEYFNAS